MLNQELSPYDAIPDVIKCARWIAVIRLFCYARTPACIYSKIRTPYSHRVFRTTHVVPLPDYVSNLLCDLNKLHSAREAELGIGQDESHVFTGVSSSFKPRGVEPYGITTYTRLRLGASLVEAVARVVGSPDLVRRALVEAVTVLGRGLEEPAPLWWDELKWLRSQGGQWLWGVIIDEQGQRV